MRQTEFSFVLLTWFDTCQRNLPWRSTKTPYFIWLSEVILQQTQVSQGTPYFLKFQFKYPTVFDLAAADEQDVLKTWEGLGYYSRARNLHKTAIEVAHNHNGIFPNTAVALQKLPGIGPYTASAIASICYDESIAAVDGNAYRVLSRFFGIDLAINQSEGIKYFKLLAQDLVPFERAGDYNQAVMEFGALVCTPKAPQCSSCPINEKCVALRSNSVSSLPFKIKKSAIKKRYFNYLLPLDATHHTRLKKRTGNGIWRHLYEFPLIESNELLGYQALSKSVKENTDFDRFNDLILINIDPIVHKLTHQHIFANFWIVHLDQLEDDFVHFSEVDQYPMPQLIVTFLKNFRNQIK